MASMGSFELSRSTTTTASAPTVLALIEDFHRWVDWSPWEGLDPQMERTYSGAESGVGSHYAWSGNAKAGQGSMEITAVTPESVAVSLTFLKPFKARNRIDFRVVPEGAVTRITWTMTGQRNVLMQLLGKLFFDKAIGKDFDRGLAQLKATAEQDRG